MSDTDLNPHREADDSSELSALMSSALRRFGDFAPGSGSSDLRLMMIEFANQVVDDIRMHPYWDGVEIPYYEHETDHRPIDDNVVIAGLLFRYAEQQGSAKYQLFGPGYYRTLNQSLWRRLNGNTKLRVRPVDGGSNIAHSRRASSINGLPVDDQ